MMNTRLSVSVGVAPSVHLSADERRDVELADLILGHHPLREAAELRRHRHHPAVGHRGLTRRHRYGLGLGSGLLRALRDVVLVLVLLALDGGAATLAT